MALVTFEETLVFVMIQGVLKGLIRHEFECCLFVSFNTRRACACFAVSDLVFKTIWGNFSIENKCVNDIWYHVKSVSSTDWRGDLINLSRLQNGSCCNSCTTSLDYMHQSLTKIMIVMTIWLLLLVRLKVLPWVISSREANWKEPKPGLLCFL